jgi:hypothetical protein
MNWNFSAYTYLEIVHFGCNSVTVLLMIYSIGLDIKIQIEFEFVYNVYQSLYFDLHAQRLTQK